MFRVQLVPDDFDVPTCVETGSFRLRPLTVNDVVRDFAAAVSSTDHLTSVFGPRQNWPQGLTLERNIADVGWHETEFSKRTSFCYVVMSPDETRYRGCQYFYPSNKVGYDVEVYLWTTQEEYRQGFDAQLFDFVRQWTTEWPFKNPLFPGRLIHWPDYEALPGKQALTSQ